MQGCGLKIAGLAGNQRAAIHSTKYSWRQARVNTETNTVQHLHAGTQCTLPELEKLIPLSSAAFHRTWTGGRNGLRGNSCCSRKGVQSLMPVREQPQAPAQAVQLGSTWKSWRAILLKALVAKSPTLSCAAVRRVLAAGPWR